MNIADKVGISFANNNRGITKKICDTKKCNIKHIKLIINFVFTDFLQWKYKKEICLKIIDFALTI